MEKLIITNCATDCSMYPEWVNRFQDSEVLAKSVAAACEKGKATAFLELCAESGNERLPCLRFL